eukprot:746989-Hanusia_phi.AAC.6
MLAARRPPGRPGPGPGQDARHRTVTSDASPSEKMGGEGRGTREGARGRRREREREERGRSSVRDIMYRSIRRMSAHEKKPMSASGNVKQLRSHG